MIGIKLYGLSSKLFNINQPLQCLRTIGVTATGVGILYQIIRTKSKLSVNHENVALITGCDSGLGYNMAIHSYNSGMFVVACFLSLNSDGAKQLESYCNLNKVLMLQLDIRNSESISDAYQTVSDFLEQNDKLSLSAFINNAGVMTFGEFEWQTDSLIENQIEINLLGTMKFTKTFLPLIRKYKTRIINVTSHCALQALPGLAPYAASKAGIKFWNDSLRIELKKYGINVVNFIPGSFIMASNIMAMQEIHANQMRQSMSDEQKQFYGDYFNRYNEYLSLLAGYKPANIIQNDRLVDTFSRALLEKDPNPVYKCEPWRYRFYHFLFAISPVYVRDWLILKFMSMPQFVKSRVESK